MNESAAVVPALLIIFSSLIAAIGFASLAGESKERRKRRKEARSQPTEGDR